MQEKVKIYCPHCQTALWAKAEMGLVGQCPVCKEFFRCERKRQPALRQQKDKMRGAGTRSTQKSCVKKDKKADIKNRFSAKRIALMAVFVALSYGVSFLEMPIFPAAPFLKLDFGNVFILLISLLLGPIEGIIVCVLKECLRLIGSSSGGVGELANMAVTTAYILLPALIYRFRKGLKYVIPCLVGACFIGTAAALLANRFINFPLYMGSGAKEAFASLWVYVLGFNLIKTASVGVLTALLYKRLSNFLKKLKF